MNLLRDVGWRVNKKEGDEAKREQLNKHVQCTRRQARIYNNHAVIQKQCTYITRKQYTSKQIKGTYSQSHNAELLPTMTDTRQHLKQYYFGKTCATYRHLHKTPKKNRSGDFPARVVPLGDRSLESLRRGAPSSCRAACSSRRAPDSSDGVFGEVDRASPAISVRTGWGNGRRSVPNDTLGFELPFFSRSDDPHEDTLERSSGRHTPVSTIRTKTLSNSLRPRLL